MRRMRRSVTIVRSGAKRTSDRRRPRGTQEDAPPPVTRAETQAGHGLSFGHGRHITGHGRHIAGHGRDVA